MGKNSKNRKQKTNDIEKVNMTYVLTKSVEKGILNANNIIDEEKNKKLQPFVTWIQAITNGLMVVFALTSIIVAGYFSKPVLENFKNGVILNEVNIIFSLDVVGFLIVGIYTFYANKHLKKIDSISDLTGISSFLLSVFATIIALIALGMQVLEIAKNS